MYGPRPGERVCKVNFSRLTDKERKNTTAVLAKQEQEIVFEESGDHYIANVKFIKASDGFSPEQIKRLNKSSRSPDKNSRGGSPGRSNSPSKNRPRATVPHKPPTGSTRTFSPSKDRSITCLSKTTAEKEEETQGKGVTLLPSGVQARCSVRSWP